MGIFRSKKADIKDALGHLTKAVDILQRLDRFAQVEDCSYCGPRIETGDCGHLFACPVVHTHVREKAGDAFVKVESV